MEWLWFGFGFGVILPLVVFGLVMLARSWWIRAPAGPPPAGVVPPVPPVTAPAAPAAAARVWRPSWNFSWIRTGTRVTTSAFTGASFVSVLLAIAAVATAIWLLQQPGLVQPSTTPPPIFTASGGGGYFSATDSWSFWLGFAAIVMVIVAFVVADRLKLVTFLFVTILVLIVYYLYKQGELDISHRRHILYILAIAAAILVLKYATKFSEKLTFGILVGALFAMLGFSHIYTWDQFTNMFTWPTWRSTQVARTTPANSACPSVKYSVTFGSAPVPINPDARCAPNVWHDGHCLWLKRARWTNDTRVYGPHCTGRFPNDVEYAWSSGVPFLGAVELVPPRYN